jgi:hypothetical protein
MLPQTPRHCVTLKMQAGCSSTQLPGLIRPQRSPLTMYILLFLLNVSYALNTSVGLPVSTSSIVRNISAIKEGGSSCG